MTSVNNDVALSKSNTEKKSYSVLQFIRYRDLIWCSLGVPIGQSHRFEVCTTVQHKSGATYLLSNLCPHRFSASVLTKNVIFVEVSRLLLKFVRHFVS